MLFDSITDDTLLQSIFALGLLGFSLFVAGALYVSLRSISGRLQKRSPKGMLPQVLGAIRKPVVLFIVLVGLFLALTALPALESWRSSLERAWTVLLVLLTGVALTNVTTGVISWYIKTRTRRAKAPLFVKLLPMARRILPVTIYGVTGLIALDSLGVSISPLLGGLGITGLAIALALQPTLSNFFAGTYVLSDGAITPGDYIELQGGPAGYVIEVGWRSTKIRTWMNNLVIIPNSVLAGTIVTNYQAPDPAMNVVVTSGVSYDSDLEKVERVGLEVAREVLQECPGAVKDTEPWFGYDSFGDSNIGFWIFVQATDRIGSFGVTNELIKRLHARFAKEHIEINYPVRKLVYANGSGH